MIETFYLKRVWARCWAWQYFSILSINLAWNFPDCIVQLKLQGAMCQLLWSPHPTQQRIIMWDMLPISQECFNGYQFQSLATLPAGILFRIDITKNIFNISKTIYLLRIDFLQIVDISDIHVTSDNNNSSPWSIITGPPYIRRGRRVPHDRRNIVTLLGKLTRGDPVVRGHWPAPPPINAASGVILSSWTEDIVQ